MLENSDAKNIDEYNLPCQVSQVSIPRLEFDSHPCPTARVYVAGEISGFAILKNVSVILFKNKFITA